MNAFPNFQGQFSNFVSHTQNCIEPQPCKSQQRYTVMLSGRIFTIDLFFKSIRSKSTYYAFRVTPVNNTLEQQVRVTIEAMGNFVQKNEIMNREMNVHYV